MKLILVIAGWLSLFALAAYIRSWFYPEYYRELRRGFLDNLGGTLSDKTHRYDGAYKDGIKLASELRSSLRAMAIVVSVVVIGVSMLVSLFWAIQ